MMTESEVKARKKIQDMSMKQLLAQWDLTTVWNNEFIPIVRGWLMDEFERRDAEAFNAWLDSDAEDEDLRRYML